MNLSFQALSPAQLEPVRASGIDDFGHSLRLFTCDSEPGTPLRCCLREARVGERIALLSWRPLEHTPDSVYAEVGPLFIHAEACDGYAEVGAYPQSFRPRPQVLRSYDADGDVVDTLLTEGTGAEAAIANLLAVPRAVVVHSRNVQAGCFMFAVEQALGA